MFPREGASKAVDIVISPDLVKQAADQMLYYPANKFNSPLHGLKLVDEVIANPHLPANPYNRRLVLQQILSEVINDAFIYRCTRLHLPLPTPFDTLDMATEIIRCISQTNNPELMAWGWLYYRYVGLDLGISQSIFCKLTYIDTRTLRRYQQHAFRRLTERLIELENKARYKSS